MQKEEADFYFLIDDSGSIERDDLNDLRDFITAFLHNFRIGPHHIRFGLVKYSDEPRLEFDLTAFSDADATKEAVKKIHHRGGRTNTGKALGFMGPYFRQAGRPNVPQYLVVITYGPSQDQVKGRAAELRKQGVTMLAIGVKDSNDTQLLEIADDPERVFRVKNFDALKSIISKVLTEICAEDGEKHSLYLQSSRNRSKSSQ